MKAFLLFLLRTLQEEFMNNPVNKKIKQRSVLKKSSLSQTTLFRIQNSIYHVLQNASPSTTRNAELAEEVLRGIEVNSHLTDYLATLEEEISQITQELAQLERTYQFAQTLGQQQEVESFELPSQQQEREHRTGLLLSRLNQVLSVSRSYGSRELLKLNRSNTQGLEEEPARGQRPPPLVFTHDF